MKPMRFEDLEATVLQLDPKARARLATRLLQSLEEFSDEELVQVWAEEARRRDANLDADPDTGIPAEQAFREARSHLS
jgi:putative addiction module component (TIGR02574 family)